MDELQPLDVQLNFLDLTKHLGLWQFCTVIQSNHILYWCPDIHIPIRREQFLIGSQYKLKNHYHSEIILSNKYIC